MENRSCDLPSWPFLAPALFPQRLLQAVPLTFRFTLPFSLLALPFKPLCLTCVLFALLTPLDCHWVLDPLPGFDFCLGWCSWDQSFGLCTDALWLSGDHWICPRSPGHCTSVSGIYFSGREHLALLRFRLPVSDKLDLNKVQCEST